MKSVLTALILSGLVLVLSSVVIEEVEVAGVPVPRATYTPGDTYTTIYSPTEVPPPVGTKPPIVKIISPVDRQAFSSNNLTLVFNLTLEASTSTYPITLDSICYKPSWHSKNITVETNPRTPYMKKTLPFSINLTSIPEGDQSVAVYACTVCEYETRRELLRQPVSQSGFIVGNFLYIDSNFYIKASSSSVNFTIDPSADEQSDDLPQLNTGIPTELVIAAGTLIVLTIAATGFMVFFEKRKR
jgi:hypothetical protein